MEIVGKHNSGANERIGFYLNSLAYEDGILDRDPVTNAHTFLYESMITHIAVRAYLGAGHDVGKRPNPGSFAHRVRFYQCILMSKKAHAVNNCTLSAPLKNP